MTSSWTGLPDPVARAFIRAPAITAPLLWLCLLAWQRLANHALTLSDALQWGLLTLLIGLPLTYFAIGILGTLAYRFLAKTRQINLAGYSLAGAVIGGGVGATLLPFFDPLGFGLIGLIVGGANGVLVPFLSARLRDAAA